MRAIPIQIGQVFTRLTVIREVESKGEQRQMECLCSCGNLTVVGWAAIRHGKTKSCGCLHSEASKRRFVTHGYTRAGEECPEYWIWCSMRRRCSNPNEEHYDVYGGRGITVCEEWQNDFAAFLAHVGRRPGLGYSIDRINNDLGYQPGNVRWATQKQQTRNTSRNVWIEYKGKRTLLIEACEDAGLTSTVVKNRRRYGWPREDWFIPVLRKGTGKVHVGSRKLRQGG